MFLAYLKTFILFIIRDTIPTGNLNILDLVQIYNQNHQCID